MPGMSCLSGKEPWLAAAADSLHRAHGVCGRLVFFGSLLLGLLLLGAGYFLPSTDIALGVEITLIPGIDPGVDEDPVIRTFWGGMLDFWTDSFYLNAVASTSLNVVYVVAMFGLLLSCWCGPAEPRGQVLFFLMCTAKVLVLFLMTTVIDGLAISWTLLLTTPNVLLCLGQPVPCEVGRIELDARTAEGALSWTFGYVVFVVMINVLTWKHMAAASKTDAGFATAALSGHIALPLCCHADARMTARSRAYLVSCRKVLWVVLRLLVQLLVPGLLGVFLWSHWEASTEDIVRVNYQSGVGGAIIGIATNSEMVPQTREVSTLWMVNRTFAGLMGTGAETAVERDYEYYLTIVVSFIFLASPVLIMPMLQTLALVMLWLLPACGRGSRLVLRFLPYALFSWCGADVWLLCLWLRAQAMERFTQLEGDRACEDTLLTELGLLELEGFCFRTRTELLAAMLPYGLIAVLSHYALNILVLALDLSSSPTRPSEPTRTARGSLQQNRPVEQADDTLREDLLEHDDEGTRSWDDF